jgi:glycosyltransferase involved in cell wall biosynthesis
METSRISAHAKLGRMPAQVPKNGSLPAKIAMSHGHAAVGKRGVPPRVSVVLPCLDELSGIVTVVHEAFEGLRTAGFTGQVIVVDNGSRDGSPSAAASAGATVLFEPRRGYGSAVRRGLQTAQGDVIVVADADRSYDLRQLGALVHRIGEGADIVVGTRFEGELDSGAMPWLHRRIGTPGLNLLLAMATGRWFRDSQSGFRAFRRDRICHLGCSADGMEFASEMLVMAQRSGFRIDEIPVRYRRRVGASKLRPLRDGLRHCSLLIRLVHGDPVIRNTRYRSSS